MHWKHWLICVLSGVAGVLYADDTSASAAYMAGRNAYLEGDYYQAATEFAKAEIEADSPAIKANALLAQIGAWRMCELYYREFQAIETLLTHYPEYANFSELIEREYAIGREFQSGKREPAYWSLRWIPWLTGPDKSSEIFSKALERAPFADSAPSARLRLAWIYDQEGKYKDSLNELRILVRDYPDSSESREYGYLALADGLLTLAQKGDGDGALTAEAVDALEELRRRNPSPEALEFANRKLLIARDRQAERLGEIAEFYQGRGRDDAAAAYLAQVLRDYPERRYAVEAEARLVEIDSTFTPGDFQPDSGARLPKFRSYELPEEATRTLIIPGENDNHYLLPVPNLKLEPATDNAIGETHQ